MSREDNLTPSQRLMKAMDPPARPYRGVLPFRLMDRPIFTGRAEETRTVFQLICVYRGVLLYGDSGAGKSSLVNAGVLPDLIMEGFAVERLRVQPVPDEEIVIERIALAEAQESSALPSIFSNEERSLSHLRRTASVAEFRRIVEEIQSLESPQGTVRVLVFDQFEELVTQFEDAQTDRAAFDQARGLQQKVVDLLIYLLASQHLRVKVLLVFRDDYFGRLAELFPAIPQIKEQSLRLISPSENNLPDIIGKPFAKVSGEGASKPVTFSRELPGEAQIHLIDGFRALSRNGLVNLTEVQIACARLWDDPRLEKEFLARTEPRAAVEWIFEGYVPQAIEELPEELREAVIAVLCRLITPGTTSSPGTRNIVSEANLIAALQQEDGFRPDLIEKALEALCGQSRLVFRHTRGTTPFYEIVSEFLVKGITAKLPGVERARAHRHALRLQVEVDEQTAELNLKNARLKRGSAFLRGIIVLALMLAGIAFGLNSRANGINERLVLEIAQKEAADKAARNSQEERDDLQVKLERERQQKERDRENEAQRVSEENKELREELAKLKAQTQDATASAGLEKVIQKLESPLIARLAGPAQPVRAADYSPDGRYVALGSADRKLRLYPRLGGEALAEGEASSSAGGVSALAFSPDGTFILTGSAGSSLRVFDPRLSKLGSGTELPVTLNTVNHISFSPDGRLSVATDNDGTAVMLDWAAYPKRVPEQPLATLKHDRRVTDADFSTDGSRLVTSGDDGLIRVFARESNYQLLDIRYNGKPQNPLYLDTGSPPLSARTPARRLQFSPVDSNLIVGGAGRSKLVWYYLSGNRLAKFQDDLHDESERGPFIHSGAVLDTAFSPDGKLLASIGTDGLCLIWDTATAKTVASLATTLHGRLLSAGWRKFRDRSILALGGEDGRLELWEMPASGFPDKPVFQTQAHSAPVVGLLFDPLNEQILTWDGVPDGYTPDRAPGSSALRTWSAWRADSGLQAAAAAIPRNQAALWSLANSLRQPGAP